MVPQDAAWEGTSPSVGNAMTVKNSVYRWLIDDRGQDLVEYVLLGATIAFVSVVVMNTFDDVINAVYVSWDSGTQAIWQPEPPQ